MAKPTAAYFLEMAGKCFEMAAAVTAQESTPAPVGVDVPMTADEIAKLRPVTPAYLKRNVAAVGRGARQKLLYRLVDVDAAIQAKPVAARPKKCPVANGEDPLEAMLRNGTLVRGTR